MNIDNLDILHAELPEVCGRDVMPPLDDDQWVVVDVEDPESFDADELWSVDGLYLGDAWEEWASPGYVIDVPTREVGAGTSKTPGSLLPRPGRPNSGESVVSCPPADCFAFYLPFHLYYPDRCGIYLIAEGVAQLASYFRWQSGGSVDIQKALAGARLFLCGHERFHHRVESFATRLEVAWRVPVYLRAGIEYHAHPFNTDDCIEEALANADGLKAIIAASAGNQLTDAAERFVLANPPGYRRGLEFVPNNDFRAGCNHLAERLHQWVSLSAQNRPLMGA